MLDGGATAHGAPLGGGQGGPLDISSHIKSLHADVNAVVPHFSRVASADERSLPFLLLEGDSRERTGTGRRMASYLFSRNVSDTPDIRMCAGPGSIDPTGAAAGSACALLGLDQRGPVTFS